MYSTDENVAHEARLSLRDDVSKAHFVGPWPRRHAPVECRIGITGRLVKVQDGTTVQSNGGLAERLTRGASDDGLDLVFIQMIGALDREVRHPKLRALLDGKGHGQVALLSVVVV